MSIFLLILVIAFCLKKAFGIKNSYMDAWNSSRSLTLKVHFNKAPLAVLARF